MLILVFVYDLMFEHGSNNKIRSNCSPHCKNCTGESGSQSSFSPPGMRTSRVPPDGRMAGWMDGWMDRWVDGHTDGWKDEAIRLTKPSEKTKPVDPFSTSQEGPYYNAVRTYEMLMFSTNLIVTAVLLTCFQPLLALFQACF